MVLTGVADPSDRGGCKTPQSYPRKEDSVIFARNLAARMSGNHVLYSINFDDWPDVQLDASAPAAGTLHDTTLLVGPELRRVSPRQLVTNHLAASAQIGAYARYHGLPWLGFDLYQSGHAGRVAVACPPAAGQPNPSNTWQNQQTCAVTRARELARALRALTPKKPVINGEGGYENPDPAALPPDNRYGMRDTAYASLFGGGGGFTAGVHQNDNKSLILWSNPGLLFGPNRTTDGILDMQRIEDLLHSQFPGDVVGWGDFNPATGVLVDTSPTPPASPVPGDRRIWAAKSGRTTFAYIPNSKTVATGSALNGFDCSRWIVEWRDPKGLALPSRPCGPNKARRTSFSPPLSCQNQERGDKFGECDWTMTFQAPATGLASAQAVGPGGSKLDVQVLEPEPPVDPEQPPEEKELVAQVIGADGIALSPPEPLGVEGTEQYGTPSPVADPLTGSYWVVWDGQAAEDGTTDVFAQRVDPSGKPAGAAFMVNQTLPGNQYGSFTVIDTLGHVTIAWTSLEQDGDQGGIFARRFAISGEAEGGEFQVNQTSAGNQEGVQLGADAAGRVVMVCKQGENQLLARVYGLDGQPVTGELGVSTLATGREELTAVEVDPLGTFTVRWEAYSESDDLLGWYSRHFDANGLPLGDELREGPPA